MRAAVITLILSNNFGAALQGVAFGVVLKQLGIKAEFYRYQNKERILYGMSFLRRILHWGMNCVRWLLTFGQRKRRFKQFRESYIPMTDKVYSQNEQLRQCPGDHDVFISGSDQIWNPEIFAQDYSYFLDFVPEGKKKISYASSFGSAGFHEAYRQKCGDLLSQYTHISVRETSGEKIVAELCGKTAITCLDPTLLLTPQQWKPMMENASTNAKQFVGILCYIMPGDKIVETAIESLAQQLHQKTGLPIMRLGIKEYKVFCYPHGETDIQAGPAEFLAYFAGAEYVVTNSFHGTAFAMNFGKKCYNPINDKLNGETALHERMISLLKQLDAMDQIVLAGQPVLREHIDMDMDRSQQLLNQLRHRSMEYLTNALGG